MPQIFAVPRRRNALARRIRARLICARCNALLAKFADMPILFVRQVPEFDRVVRVEIIPARMRPDEKTNRTQSAYDPVLAARADAPSRSPDACSEACWEKWNSRKRDDDPLLLISPTGSAQALPLIVRLAAFRDGHEAAKKRSFGQIVLRRIVRRDLRKHRMHAGTVIALRIVFEDLISSSRDTSYSMRFAERNCDRFQCENFPSNGANHFSSGGGLFVRLMKINPSHKARFTACKE